MGFSTIANDCIFYGIPRWPKAGQDVCEAALDKAEEMITTLYNKLRLLIEEAKYRLVYRTGRLYITGYAKLVNNGTKPCGKTNYGWWGVDKSLSQGMRTRLNVIVDELNAIIEAVAEEAGEQVVFVPIDHYVTNCKGRLCEATVDEPQPDRADLMFFMPNSHDKVWDDKHALTWTGNQNSTQLTKRALGFSTFLPNNMLRWLHPKSNLHRMIADLILAHMQIEADKAAGIEPFPLPGPDTCPVRKVGDPSPWWCGRDGYAC
jgi:hypothetical protein